MIPAPIFSSALLMPFLASLWPGARFGLLRPVLWCGEVSFDIHLGFHLKVNLNIITYKWDNQLLNYGGTYE
jgi:hypothetical protein